MALLRTVLAGIVAQRLVSALQLQLNNTQSQASSIFSSDFCECGALALFQEKSEAANPFTSERLVLAPHHKTGYVLTRKSLKCIEAAHPDKSTFIMGHRLAHSPRFHKNTKIIHISREPLDLVVSIYLYDKFAAADTEVESFLRPNSAYWARQVVEKELGKDPWWMEVHGNETFRQYLQRVPERLGLRAVQYVTLQEARKIEDASEWCRASKQCLEVSETIMTKDSKTFNGHWKRIFEFAGLKSNPSLNSCLSMQDINTAQFQNSRFAKHCSSNKVSKEEREALMEHARHIDQVFFRSHYAKASNRYAYQFRRQLHRPNFESDEDE